jgi:acetyltransferase
VEKYGHLIISPYLTRYVWPWRCRYGRMVLLRPIKPGDELLERELITELSEQSMIFRFFYLIKDITHEMLTRFCNIDYDREMAIIAEYTSNSKRRNVGFGRLMIEPSAETGEFAILVAYNFQGGGLGLKLTDMLIGVAYEKRLKSICDSTLRDNTAFNAHLSQGEQRGDGGTIGRAFKLAFNLAVWHYTLSQR